MPSPTTMDQAHAAVSAQAKSTMLGILAECGVDRGEFESVNDGELQIAELSKVMGRIWVTHARAAALEEEWRKALEARKHESEALFARSYFLAAETLGKGATETAKRNWIVENKSEVVAAEEKIREAEYMTSMVKAARRSIEIRVDMLQSLNKLKVSEMERLHVHLRAGEGG